jgi:hypothetical protein
MVQLARVTFRGSSAVEQSAVTLNNVLNSSLTREIGIEHEVNCWNPYCQIQYWAKGNQQPSSDVSH